MTDRITSRSRESRDMTGVLRWKNTSGETIPAFGCVKLNAFDAVNKFYNAVKPDGEGNLHFFNGPVDIAANAFGESSIWGQASVLGLTDGVFGDTVGPTAGSWEMTTGGSGFTVFSNPTYEGVAAVLRDGGSGGVHTMWFTIVDVHCPDDYDPEWYIRVTPLYYTGNCGSVPPGRQADGYWYVYSFCGDNTEYVDSELPGTTGWGTYAYPYTADSYPTPECIPAWFIEQLCAIPECS